MDCRARRVRTRLGSATALVALLGACGPPDTGPAPTQDPESHQRSALSRKGSYVVSWRLETDEIPFNEPFDLEVQVSRPRSGDDPQAPSPKAGAPVEGAQVFVRCDMPAHGHGMNVEPRATELGGGRYRVEGMLLHMRGDWLLGIDVVLDGTAETADFELALE